MYVTISDNMSLVSDSQYAEYVKTADEFQTRLNKRYQFNLQEIQQVWNTMTTMKRQIEYHNSKIVDAYSIMLEYGRYPSSKPYDANDSFVCELQNSKIILKQLLVMSFIKNTRYQLVRDIRVHIAVLLWNIC